jgi:phage-related protein
VPKYHRTLLPIAVCIFIFIFPTPKATAFDLVYDPINWAENLIKQIQQTVQTSTQGAISATASTISSINSVISQVTQYISKLENMIQQAVGTVTSKIQLIQQLYGEIASIPNSFENAYASILNIPSSIMAQGFNSSYSSTISNWQNSNDPITRYLGGALSGLQSLAGLLNGIGFSVQGVVNGADAQIGRLPTYNAPAYSANLTQGLGAATLISQPSSQKVIATLQAANKSATTQQQGQAADNQARIQALAAQARINQMAAARQLAEGQTRTNEIQRYNTNVAGAEDAAADQFYNTFQP